ncbi:MAG: SNF2-related protein [Prolixibacteraceae bacterium]|jgi:SNF2 family DNA or RNA helicase|nr:SNF2-related protein [Prolixibacteraceae bacterium]
MHIYNNKSIEDFCHDFGTQASLNRGYYYFINGRIINSMKLSDEPLSIEYNVLGNSGVYDVVVTQQDDDYLETSCNCPYTGEGICKHQVASLIYFDKHEQNNLLEIPFTEDLSPASELIPADDFDEEFADNLLRERNIMPGYLSDMRLEFQSFHSNQLKSKVFTGYWTQNSYQVIAKHKEGNIEFSCSCKQNTNDFCKHQLLVLYELSRIQYFPTIIIPDKLQKFKEEIIGNYGLKGKVSPDEFVSIRIENSNIFPIMTKEFIGLMPVKEVFLRNTITEHIPDHNKHPHIIKPDFAEQPVENEKRTSKYAIGYMIYSNFINSFEIVPVSGKLNKSETAIISNFQLYNDDNHALLNETETDEKIISLCKKIQEKHISLQLSLKKINTDEYPELYTSRERSHFYHQHINEIVNLLSGHPYLFLYNGSAYDLYNHKLRKSETMSIKLNKQRAKFFYRVTQNELFTEIQPSIALNNSEFIPDENRQNLFSFMFLKQGENIYAFENEHQSVEVIKSLQHPKPLKIVKEHTDAFLKEIVLPKAENIEIKFDNIENFEIKTMKLKPVSRKIYISGEGNFVMFKPVVEYQNEIEVEVLKKGTPLKINGQTIHQQIRDASYEEDFETFFRTLHPQFQKQFPYEFYNLKAQQMIENYWFFDAFAKLQEAGIEVFGLNNLKNFRYNTNQASINTNLKSGRDWFEADVEIAFGDNKVSLSDVRKSLIKKEKYIKLADGTIGLLPQEWLDKFERYLRAGEIKEGKIRISKTKFPLIDDLFDNIKDEEVLKELSEKTRKLKSFSEIKKVKLPTGIKGTLRHYQKEGLNWLNFLHEFKWGGILADDMGLGKTLQAITFLKKISTKSKAPSLVVVPTTLIFNWHNEIEKFCPSLKALFHYGPDRTKSTDHFNEYHVIITTYGHIINDIIFLKDIKYNYIILDESQAIKNPASKRYKSVKVLKANNRLAMTGTPIENGTFDLYAQMSFVNPGMLGSNKQFREDFSTPIDRDSNQKRASELQKMVSPFILRRTKEQVATELPPKTEDIIYCTMDDEQRKVYDAYRNEIRKQLLNKIEEDGLERSKIHILEGLTKLRQICDSPSMLSDNENYGNGSIKIEELSRHMTNKTANHKIVIFSQFVKMLSLIKNEINKLDINYEYLDGKCNQKQRKESVKRFQEDENCRVFLISLKAGGTGINLTAADYVYIVDPWWNPAVENQAIDRCYRIGQDKKVFAYRMICKDTIEEKIVDYQGDKKAVSDSIIQTDENIMKKLTKEDVMSIFG